jgi:hypothetical protein
MGILMGMYVISPLNKEMYRANFDRNFLGDDAVSRRTILDLGSEGYYFAGASAKHLYLGNWTQPNELLAVNIIESDTQKFQIKINNLDSKKIEITKQFRLAVDSPYFFLSHGVMPGLFRGTLDRLEAYRFMPDSAYFVEAVPIGGHSFALRSRSRKSNAYELAKQTKDTPHFEFKYGLLEKQIDGIFCVDGSLHYNSDLKKLIYLYAYRNQYIVMDTNLNLVDRFHTIDTFSRVQMKVANIESGDYSMLATPPAIINGISSVSGDYLFIQSNLLAHNEDQDKFSRSAVIDVYNINTGSYTFSFYINRHLNKATSGFQVSNNHLAVIFEKHLVIYDLDQNIFFKKAL